MAKRRRINHKVMLEVNLGLESFDEVFRTGILKSITKANIYEKESVELAKKICCFCLKEGARNSASCVYHSRCYRCLNKSKKDCMLCKAFGFKLLEFKCANCKQVNDLEKMAVMSCLHKRCESCKGTNRCNICCKVRIALMVSFHSLF